MAREPGKAWKIPSVDADGGKLKELLKENETKLTQAGRPMEHT